jgi:hypothetical protein
MKIKVIVSLSFILLVAVGFLVFLNKSRGDQKPVNELYEENEENEEHEATYQYLRWKYEADLIKDPTTGEAYLACVTRKLNLQERFPKETPSGLARLTKSK